MISPTDNLETACRDVRPGPVDHVIDAEARERLVEAMGRLSRSETIAVSMHFGLADGRQRSAVCVARRLKVRVSLAELLIESAIAKLRRAVDNGSC